jgi:hypothetical protein
LDGVVLSAADVAGLDPADWPVEFFDPTVGQVAGALALVAVGLGITLAIDRVAGGSGNGKAEGGDGGQ